MTMLMTHSSQWAGNQRGWLGRRYFILALLLVLLLLRLYACKSPTRDDFETTFPRPSITLTR
jgi:hypothetical protein